MSIGSHHSQGCSRKKNDNTIPTIEIAPRDQNGTSTYPIFNPKRNRGPEIAGPRVLARQPNEAAAPLIVAR